MYISEYNPFEGFLCFLFGHNWRAASSFNLKKSGQPLSVVTIQRCRRCPETKRKQFNIEGNKK